MARPVYQQYLKNEITGETVLIRSTDPVTFQSKIDRKRAQWAIQNERLKKQLDKESAIHKAREMTEQSQKELAAYRNILKDALQENNKINWNELFDTKPFREYAPNQKPDRQEFENSVPKASALEFISFLKNKRLKAEEAAKVAFEKAVADWKEKEAKQTTEYETEKKEYLKNQSAHNEKLEKIKKEYENQAGSGIAKYFSLVLEKSKYPNSLGLSSSVHYDEAAKILLVDMELPASDKFIQTVEYKYNATTRETTGKTMGKKEFDDFYNDALYQIALRTIHEIFESDYQDCIEAAVFNGWVDKMDPQTGNQMRNCILSLHVSKKEFSGINLENINPRECFSHLKGITAGSLVNLSPIKPIMVLNTEDKRFIRAKNILSGFDEKTNLATMDWQDFEVLTRDLIQKEFSREGCKVEVTRASRDAGVDAVAFDEDPIRGGKYVIQAKRYNNLVPLSAVRDLYGTVMNEGAVKGILVTTSHYGGDALEFVKDKPLTLINGEQLLYMFNKHGYDMKIELTKKQRAASSVSY